MGVVRYAAYHLALIAEDRRYNSGQFAQLPPPTLRHRVHGALDPISYKRAGEVVAREVVQALREHGVVPESRVLDFACGPGRVASEVKALEPSWSIHGSDIDPAAIAWASTHLPNVAQFTLNDSAPPTAYASDSFDAIYSVSLLTHLDQDAQVKWLQEFRRLIRPGGVVIVTVHGASTFGSCTRDELKTLEADGFAFRTGRTGWLKLDGLPDAYQTTFHTRAYIERVWKDWFKIVAYREGGLANHQDMVVLRK